MNADRASQRPCQHPEIVFGRVMHRRLTPVEHAFSYGVFYLRVPLTQIAQLPNRWLSLDGFNLLSFMRRDYGARDGGDLLAWARALLAQHGVQEADGEIILQTFPRLLGYVFNPISIWYCYDRQGDLRAAICEVSNTFGERHNYLLAHPDTRAITQGDWLSAKKCFHVSPFCEVQGQYRFRFEQTDTRAFAEIDYYVGERSDEKLMVTTIHGTPQPLTSHAALRAFLSYPLMTFAVVIRIHWQAVKLWVKRVPWFSKPAPPTTETTR